MAGGGGGLQPPQRQKKRQEQQAQKTESFGIRCGYDSTCGYYHASADLLYVYYYYDETSDNGDENPT